MNADASNSLTPRDLEQLRTAHLLFDAELQGGTLAAEALSAPEVRRATAVSRVPSRPLRLAQQVRYRLGGLRFDSAVLEPLLAARRTALGARSAAPPRFLIRVDEFPHYMAEDEPERFGVARFERFHEIMSASGVPYLLAVLPRVSHEPLAPTATGSRALEAEELEMLTRLRGEGVTLALHGLDHRTRFASPRRHSELCGLTDAQLESLLDEALGELAPHEIRPQVFVAPYNRFDPGQFRALARRFTIVCGGPESIGLMGFQGAPQWRGESVYLPSYAPFYGHCNEILPAVERMIEQACGLWIPLVLHWGWEADDGFSDLESLLARVGPHAADWGELANAIERSRAAGSRSHR